MPVFSPRSKFHLDQCHDDLRRIAIEVLKYMDIAVIEGRRDESKQREMVKNGLSQLDYPHSKHNLTPSAAVHFAPVPVNLSNAHKNIARFYVMAGVVLTVAKQLNINIRWGGDWDGDGDFSDQTFDDLMHFELL